MKLNTDRIKIKICAGWENTESITRRLISQFLTKELSEKFEFVFDDSYDVIVFNNYITETPKNNSKSLIFFHEPSWSGSHQKNFIKTDKDEYDLKIFGYDISNYNISGFDFFESPSKMFYGGRGPWCEGYDFWSIDNLFSTNFDKKKSISSVVSCLGEDGNYGPEGCLYRDRSNLIKKLITRFEKVDFYGWEGHNPNIKGFLHQKKDGLIDYKFSLCIENTHEKNYISEKFLDCILTNTIPIYYGCANIKELIPEDCYILLDSITDHEYVIDVINHIESNCQDLYSIMLENLLTFKKRYLRDFNPLIDVLNF
jgi:hypothetical protein